MSAVGTPVRLPASLAGMSPARRRIFLAGIRANIRDPEAAGRPAWGELERQRLAEQRRQERDDKLRQEAEAAMAKAAAEKAERERAEAERGARLAPLGLSAKRVVAEVAATHELTPEQVIGRNRLPHIVEARHEVMWRLHVELGMASAAVGRRLNRDHSTVLHGARMHAERHGLARPGEGRA